MQKENQNFTAILGQEKKHHQKKNRFLLFCGSLFFLFIISAALYLWKPAACTEFIGFFLPDEQYRLTVRIGKEDHELPLFYKRWAHERNSGEIVPALVLCDLPVAGGGEHIKIFPDCLGVFQTPEKWFSAGRFSLMIREGARTTIPLEDNIKGWNAEYHILHRDGVFYFNILPWPQNKEPVSFSIPEKLLGRIPCFEETSSLKSLPEHQIIKPYRTECEKNEMPLILQ